MPECTAARNSIADARPCSRLTIIGGRVRFELGHRDTSATKHTGFVSVSGAKVQHTGAADGISIVP